MAQASTAIRSIKRDMPFSWEGMRPQGPEGQGPHRRAERAGAARRTAPPGHCRDAHPQAVTASRAWAARSTPGDIAIFSRQLATMLGAGIPLVQAFEIIGAGHEKPSMQKLLLEIKADIEGGTSLHESLAKHPLYFDDLLRQPDRGRRAGRCAGVAARQDRDLQGKDRGHQEEGQEGAVLSGRGAGRGGDRHDHPADLRDPAVREPVQGLRRRPAGVHADGHQPVEVRAAQRRLHRRS